MTNKRIPVAELYGPVIQGEGYVQGERTMFLRTALCDGATGDGKASWCSWCDSMNAVDIRHPFAKQWRWMTEEQIIDELNEKAPYCKTVTITGGNPLLHDLTLLTNMLERNGYRILVETQGTLFKPWLWNCHVVTVSPKPPSAGHWLDIDTQLDAFLEAVSHSFARVVIKIVVDIDDPHDYGYACEVAKRYGEAYDVYFLCRTRDTDTRDQLLDRYKRLEMIACMDAFLPTRVKIGLQQHVVLHGHKTGI